MIGGMSEDETTPPPTSAPDASDCKTRKVSFAELFSRIKKSGIDFYDEIWKPTFSGERSFLVRTFFLLWRVIEITVARTLTNRIPLQAAALTYYLLMALAPFVMFGLTIFGIVMNVKGEEAVETMKQRIGETMQLIAPETTAAEQNAAEAASLESGQTVVATVAPELQEFANNLLESTMANSSSAGTIGFIILAVLAIFMVARVEDAYNLMWNVKVGRSWSKRFLVYFLFLFFGGALMAVAASMLSVSAAFKRISSMTGVLPDWVANLPGGETFFELMTSFVPTLVSFLALTLAFACLNKYMPKTAVRWKPALIGGGFVSLVFIVNQKLTLLYMRQISEFNSIYGNLSVIFIIMFMLYMGWIFVLLGGQLSFAVQNARFLKNLNREWAELSPRSKQEAFFACLFANFAKCSREPVGFTPNELSQKLSVPVNHVLECVDVLEAQGMIVPLASDGNETRYNTTGSVPKMTVSEIKRRFDNLREPLFLGGDREIRLALKRFSRAFFACRDTMTVDELLRIANSRDKRSKQMKAES